MPKFSERLKLLRNQRNLSQQELSKQLGVLSKSSINMYERGEREPGLETLELIADFFNVDMDYLLGKSDIPNRNANLMDELLNQMVEDSISGRTAAMEEMFRLFGGDHEAVSLRLCDEKTAVLYYRALNHNCAPVLMNIIFALEKLEYAELENMMFFIHAYLRADEPIKKIVNTALQPYRKKTEI